MLAYLFGSLALKGDKGDNLSRPPGDVDLAILTKDGPAYGLLEAVADVLGTDRLDLVDLRKASPILRFEVLRSGRPIYISDESLRERYEMETLHLYRDTEPIRRRQSGSEREDGCNVFRKIVVEMRLKELDAVVRQLNKYRDIKPDTMKQDC